MIPDYHSNDNYSNEAMVEYNSVRRNVEYVQYDMSQLETVIGKHAVLMIDIIRSGQKIEFGQRLERIHTAWSNVLKRNVQSGEETDTGWSPFDMDRRFRNVVDEMVRRFSVFLQKMKPEDEISDETYKQIVSMHGYLQPKKRETQAQTQRLFAQYVSYLRRLHAEKDNTQSLLFYQLATACILSGAALGTFLDSVLL